MQQNNFIQWFETEVKGRWAKCAFTAVQLNDWYWRLKRYDAAALTAAARRHHVQDDPRRPSLKAIHEYARQRQAKHVHAGTGTAPANESAGVPEAHTYIQCVGKDENGNGPVGWFVPILLWPFGKAYTRPMYQKTAEEQLTMHQLSRGGVWEIVAPATHSAMRIRQWKLTGQWDRIEQQARKCRRQKE